MAQLAIRSPKKITDHDKSSVSRLKEWPSQDVSLRPLSIIRLSQPSLKESGYPALDRLDIHLMTVRFRDSWKYRSCSGEMHSLDDSGLYCVEPSISAGQRSGYPKSGA